MSDLPAAPGRRFELGRYTFEYERRRPRGRRWGCESRGRGISCCATPLRAWIGLRRWLAEEPRPS